MNAILDTHAFLWWILDDPRLSRTARDIMGDEENTLFVSAASAWEIAIKAQLGKPTLANDPQTFVPSQLALNGFVELPVRMRHALRVHSLPLHHRDPFDRLLVAQSQVEGVPLVTADSWITQYSVDVIW